MRAGSRIASGRLAALLAAALMCAPAHGFAAESKPCVILLHGLGQTALSMLPLKFALDREGYRTVNQGYPSLAQPIEELSASHVPGALAKCDSPPDEPVHFVTHSMGGILVRHYLQDHDLPDGSRMVMLGPPNRGSEWIDRFADDVWFSVMGPAALQMGTGADSLPGNLQPIDMEIGVVAGTRAGLDTIVMRNVPLPGPNDGRVTVASSRLDEMRDFFTVEESHSFLLTNPLVIEQAVAFLGGGRFRAANDPRDSR